MHRVLSTHWQTVSRREKQRRTATLILHDGEGADGSAVSQPRLSPKSAISEMCSLHDVTIIPPACSRRIRIFTSILSRIPISASLSNLPNQPARQHHLDVIKHLQLQVYGCHVLPLGG